MRQEKPSRSSSAHRACVAVDFWSTVLVYSFIPKCDVSRKQKILKTLRKYSNRKHLAVMQKDLQKRMAFKRIEVAALLFFICNAFGYNDFWLI